MSDITVNISSNRKLVEEASDEAIARALEAIGLQCERYAKGELSKPKEHADGRVKPNVDTGNLRNSITHAVDVVNKRTYVGTNVEYAA